MFYEKKSNYMPKFSGGGQHLKSKKMQQEPMELLYTLFCISGIILM